jgi:hypothetical protein
MFLLGKFTGASCLSLCVKKEEEKWPSAPEAVFLPLPCREKKRDLKSVNNESWALLLDKQHVEMDER